MSLFHQTPQDGFHRKILGLRSDILHAKDGEVGILISYQW